MPNLNLTTRIFINNDDLDFCQMVSQIASAAAEHGLSFCYEAPAGWPFDEEAALLSSHTLSEEEQSREWKEYLDELGVELAS